MVGAPVAAVFVRCSSGGPAGGVAQHQRERLAVVLHRVVRDRHRHRLLVLARHEGQRALRLRIVGPRLRRPVPGPVVNGHLPGPAPVELHHEVEGVVHALGRLRVRHGQRRRVVVVLDRHDVGKRQTAESRIDAVVGIVAVRMGFEDALAVLPVAVFRRVDLDPVRGLGLPLVRRDCPCRRQRTQIAIARAVPRADPHGVGRPGVEHESEARRAALGHRQPMVRQRGAVLVDDGHPGRPRTRDVRPAVDPVIGQAAQRGVDEVGDGAARLAPNLMPRPDVEGAGMVADPDAVVVLVVPLDRVAEHQRPGAPPALERGPPEVPARFGRAGFGLPHGEREPRPARHRHRLGEAHADQDLLPRTVGVSRLRPRCDRDPVGHDLRAGGRDQLDGQGRREILGPPYYTHAADCGLAKPAAIASRGQGQVLSASLRASSVARGPQGRNTQLQAVVAGKVGGGSEGQKGVVGDDQPFDGVAAARVVDGRGGELSRGFAQPGPDVAVGVFGISRQALPFQRGGPDFDFVLGAGFPAAEQKGGRHRADDATAGEPSGNSSAPGRGQARRETPARGGQNGKHRHGAGGEDSQGQVGVFPDAHDGDSGSLLPSTTIHSALPQLKSNAAAPWRAWKAGRDLGPEP